MVMGSPEAQISDSESFFVSFNVSIRVEIENGGKTKVLCYCLG